MDGFGTIKPLSENLKIYIVFFEGAASVLNHVVITDGKRLLSGKGINHVSDNTAVPLAREAEQFLNKHSVVEREAPVIGSAVSFGADGDDTVTLGTDRIRDVEGPARLFPVDL